VEEDSLAGLAAVDDPELEWKFCVGALPAMLVLGVLFHLFTPFLQRTFLAMPVHELGHAVTAWLCGYAAVPIVWKTFVPEERGFVAPLLVLGAMGYLMFRAWQAEKAALLALGAGVVLLAVFGTLGIREKTAQMLITFGGDGMGMVLATVLMATFFFGKDTQLYRGSLRWGLIAIGAAAYVDMFSVWLAARRDYGRIPFGEQEGGLLSDATKLVDDHGWSADQLVNRYIALGVCCLIALTLIYAWGVRQAWVLKDGSSKD